MRSSSALSLLLVLCAFVPSAHAGRLAVISRGVGPGSDKPTALVDHFVAEAFATDERFELLNTSLALGNPDRDKALRQFQISEDLFQKAREAYDGLDLEAAETALKGAIKRYERYSAYIADFKKMSDALLLLGAVNILKGNERGGTAALEQAIGIYPAAEPDPRVFNPAMRVQFSQVAARLGTQPTGTVTVSSSPSYGTVFVDGKFVGVTPVPVEGLTPGRHIVRVEREGYRPWGAPVDVVSRGEAAVSATMRAATHFDEFDSLADRAVRSLDEDDKGADDRQIALRAMAELLDADSLFVAKVRLDGEHVRVFCDLYEVHGKKAEKTGEHVFAYDMQPVTYEREVRIFLHEEFGLDAGADIKRGARDAAEAQIETEDKTLPHAGRVRGSCGLVSCPTAKKITLGALMGAGGVAIVTGGIEWALAKKVHSQWRKTTQTASNQAGLRVKGYNHAIAGDVLMGMGVVGVATGLIIAGVWHPSTSVEDIAAEQPPEPLRRHRNKRSLIDVSMLPVQHGAMAQATWRFP